jgi:hypothetical protein
VRQGAVCKHTPTHIAASQLAVQSASLVYKQYQSNTMMPVPQTDTWQHCSVLAANSSPTRRLKATTGKQESNRTTPRCPTSVQKCKLLTPSTRTSDENAAQSVTRCR